MFQVEGKFIRSQYQPFNKCMDVHLHKCNPFHKLQALEYAKLQLPGTSALISITTCCQRQGFKFKTIAELNFKI